ncbi:multisubstrate pseudouridine synthase 7, partial [Coemansia asiatica]
MQKENTDSMDVLSQIARKLHVKPKSFGMAGTKDKRGITVQRCSAFRVDHKRLIGASRQLRSIRLGNFSYGAEELKLGRLAGNRFCIVLRFVQGADAESLAPVLAGLRDTGFINYYGMQRFGTQSISSHTVGLAVLKADWQLVVDLILRPRPGDSKDVARARALWAEGDFTGALRAMPPKAALAERSVLQTFASAGSKANAMAAFNAIPRNLRLMYVHAYQSFIWNTAASHRVRLFGVDSAVPGDLVIRSTGFCQSNADDQQPEPADDATHTEPLLVTADNAHEYSIYDVVLPLPGWAVKYPGHQVKAVYQETMQRDGLCPETMDKHPLKEYRLAGAYRHIVIRPRDFCFEWMRFDNDTLPLTQSDSDVIEGKSVPVSVEDGKHVALKLAFDLPSSAYATMLLRELIRKETTAGHHMRNITNAIRKRRLTNGNPSENFAASAVALGQETRDIIHGIGPANGDKNSRSRSNSNSSSGSSSAFQQRSPTKPCFSSPNKPEASTWDAIPTTGLFSSDSGLLKRVSSMPGNISIFRAHLTNPLQNPEFHAAPQYTRRQAVQLAANEPDDTPLYGVFLLGVTSVVFVVSMYALVVSKFMPYTGIALLDAIKDDDYFCLLVPIT